MFYSIVECTVHYDILLYFKITFHLFVAGSEWSLGETKTAGTSTTRASFWCTWNPELLSVSLVQYTDTLISTTLLHLYIRLTAFFPRQPG